jgi:serine/threonine protein kinase
MATEYATAIVALAAVAVNPTPELAAAAAAAAAAVPDVQKPNYVVELAVMTAAGQTRAAKPSPQKEVVGQGGFGSVHRETLVLTPEGEPALSIGVVRKVVKAASRRSGTEILTELAIMRAVYRAAARRQSLGGVLPARPTALMPALEAEVDSRSSTARILMPAGLCDVSEFARRSALLPQAVCERWFCDVLEGVTELHLNGVAHGDIKPGNMIVIPAAHPGSEGENAIRAAYAAARGACPRDASSDIMEAVAHMSRACISDYGLASFIADAASGVVERSSAYAYTAPYRAPEVWNGGTWSYSAESWALGCSFYEIAFGGRPLFIEAPAARAADQSVRRIQFVDAIEQFCLDHDFFAADGEFELRPAAAKPVVTTVAAASENGDLWTQCSGAATTDLRKMLGACLQFAACMRLLTADLCAHPFFAAHPRIAALGAERAVPYPVIDFVGGFSDEHRRVAATAISRRGSSIVAGLAGWIAEAAMLHRASSRSTRLRKMSDAAVAALAAAVAAKVMRINTVATEAEDALRKLGAGGAFADPATSRYEPPSSARDESALCALLDFRLFPFGPLDAVSAQ